MPNYANRSRDGSSQCNVDDEASRAIKRHVAGPDYSRRLGCRETLSIPRRAQTISVRSRRRKRPVSLPRATLLSQPK